MPGNIELPPDRLALYSQSIMKGQNASAKQSIRKLEPIGVPPMAPMLAAPVGSRKINILARAFPKGTSESSGLAKNTQNHQGIIL